MHSGFLTIDRTMHMRLYITVISDFTVQYSRVVIQSVVPGTVVPPSYSTPGRTIPENGHVHRSVCLFVKLLRRQIL
jgi:hypothetical protein